MSELHQEASGPVTLLRPTGTLDARGARELDAAIGTLVADDRCWLVIDLETTDAIDSTGARTLLRVARRLEHGGGSLVLCSLPPSIQEAFEVSGVAAEFHIAPDRYAALDRLSPERIQANTTGKLAARLLGARPAPRALAQRTDDEIEGLASRLLLASEGRKHPESEAAEPQSLLDEHGEPKALAFGDRIGGWFQKFLGDDAKKGSTED